MTETKLIIFTVKAINPTSTTTTIEITFFHALHYVSLVYSLILKLNINKFSKRHFTHVY